MQTISIRPGYVLVERPEDYEVVLSEQPAELLKISECCKESGCRKVLILGPRTNVRLSVADIYDLGESIAKLGLKIAVVESHNASDSDVEFLENVVSNRRAGSGRSSSRIGITKTFAARRKC